MKTAAPIGKKITKSSRAAKILASLRNARKQAVKSAKLHQTPVVYLQDGKLVKERP